MSMLLAALGEALLNSDLLLKGAGGGAFLLYNAGTWRPHHFVGWGMAVLLGAFRLRLFWLCSANRLGLGCWGVCGGTHPVHAYDE